jgi:wyosine [tRNA(Phe)-imidazoG37] synthetase (radical SAM superfamily)
VSRRARGLSIGVNLNPDKACNFDCPYCQVDRTTSGGRSRVNARALARELQALLERARGELWSSPPFDSVTRELRRLADVAFAGDAARAAGPHASVYA